ncbi:MAG TPA: hypothetical protein VF187_10860 [Gemmatimonadales bacterium]
MSFDFRDIRPAMDVYTLDNVYLGTVLAIIPGPAAEPSQRVPANAMESSEISGEMLGPAPTQTVGNRGPANQSARARYAVKPDAKQIIGHGAITVGRWWGLRGRRTIPMDAVQTVSLERVVLRLTADEL